MEYGYIRHSPALPYAEDQLLGLHLPKEAIFEDVCSIKDSARPNRQRLLDIMQNGDIIHVQSLDRIARNVKDLLQTLTTITNKGVTIHFIKEDLTISQNINSEITSTILNTLDFLSIWERTLLRELQEEGKQAARLAGKHFGRPTNITDAQKDEVKRLILEDNNKSILQISKETGVPRTTCYRIKDALKSQLENKQNPSLSR
ncbi:MAG: recombinase family protein [Desulfovibrio sp.]|nr:recombinase family protein [Desulfovibrio sp.]